MTENKVYYSKIGLSLPVTKLQRVLENGESKVLEPRYVEFSRMGADKFFMLSTNDEQVQAVLEKRIVEVGDVFGPEEYQRLAIPPEMRAAQLSGEVSRLTEERNRLLAKLNEQKAEVSAKK